MGAPIIWFGNAAKLLKQTLTLPDSSSNTVSIATPSSVTSYTLTLPTAQGASHTTLHNDGSGNLSFSPIALTTDVSGILPAANGGSPPTTVNLFVDKSRTDSFTPDGSLARPFATIGAAITQIISNGDNNTKAYSVNVAAGGYSETLTFNSSTLYNISFIANPTTNGAQNCTVTGLTSTSNNTQLATLTFTGITFNGNVNLTGDVNNTNFASTQILFSYCQFNNSSGTIVLNNVNNVNMYNCQVQGSGSVSTFTNVAFAYMEGAEGYIGGTTLHLVQNNGGNQPSQAEGNYFLMSTSKFYGTMTIDAGSELDFLQSYAGSGNSITNNGTIHSFGSYYSGTLIVNNGSSTRLQGDTIYGTFTQNAGSTTTNRGVYYGTGANLTSLSASSPVLTDASKNLVSGNIALGSQVSGTLLIANGGTNITTYTTGDTLYASASNVLSKLAIGTTGQVLSISGGVPAWSSTPTLTLTNTHIYVGNGSNVATDVAVSGDLTLANTGAFTIANAAVTNAKIANATIDLTTKVTGALPIVNAGTNITTYTTGDTLYASASNVLSKLAIGTTGQVLSISGGIPTWSSTPTLTLTSAHLYVGNASNVATDVAASGDLTLANTGAFTFNTVNSNVGSFGSSTSIPNFTVNAKGLITAAGGNVVIAPAGTLTGTTLASNVVSSSLTSVGTITSGTWTATAISISNGGTGQATKTAGFDALQPMTTGGDLIYGGASGTGTRLANGTVGQVLQSQGGTAAPAWFTPGASYYWMNGGNGLGGSVSGETTVRNFTSTQASAGSDITYTARTTTNGDKFTINTAGIYFVTFCDYNTASHRWGITKNSTSLSSSPGSIADSQLLIQAMNVASEQVTPSVSVPLAVNDVIRVQTETGGTPATTTNDVKFWIVRVM
jgi:hypothetical protein